MRYGGGNPLTSLPEVVKNILIINVLMLLATFVSAQSGVNLNEILGLHHWSSDKFRVYQLVTYMFMHGGFMHLFFNMFAVWMFGKVLEEVWGSKRFLTFYMITGIGAGLVQMLVNSIDLNMLESAIEAYAQSPTPSSFEAFIDENVPSYYEGSFREIVRQWVLHPQATGYMMDSVSISRELLEIKRDTVTVGASGSVFGILLAFGMMFPNVQLMLLIPPIPLKAKYFVILYGIMELYLGISRNPTDNVAHFAHLGGMLFGFILIMYWRKNTSNYF